MSGNRPALEKSIVALTSLRPEHDALVAHARTLASLIDEFPHEVKLHSEYREALKRLDEAGKPRDTDALAELLRELRDDRSESQPG